MSRFGGRGAEPGETQADTYDPATDCWCQHCGQQFNGSDSSGGHCKAPGCCQSFASMNAFNKHRVGRFEPDERRCLTPDELLAKGWSQTGPHGSWRTPAPANNPWKDKR